MRKLSVFLIFAVMSYADAPWTPDVHVSVEAPWDSLNQGESCFAIYGDTIVAICNTAERGSVPIAPYAYSFDGGQTFTHVPFTDSTVGVTWHTDPVIAFDDSGHVHMIIQYSLYYLYHYLSRDGGQTWAETTLVWGTYGLDKPWMVVNRNEIHITWQQTSGPVGIQYAKSTDYGSSFSTSHIWSRTGITALCIDENENLHLGLVHWGAGTVYYRKSTNHGTTWGPEFYLGNFSYSTGWGDRAPLNSIAARGNVVYTTWVDQSSGNWDIVGVRSTDGGSTWSSPTVINDITTGGQCKDWVLFDVHGGLHLVYYHTFDWPTNPSSLFDFRYQFSPDSGATWNTGMRVSDVSVPTMADFIGEYHITQADDLYLYAIWTDGRNGDDNDLYFSKALLSELGIEEKLITSVESSRILMTPTIWNGNVVMRIAQHSHPVTIKAYDVSGRMIKELYAGKPITPVSLQLNGSDFPQGVLFIKLISKETSETKKVINLR